MRRCFQIGAVTIAFESAFPLDCGGLFRAFAVSDTAEAELIYRVSYVDLLPSSENAEAYETCLVQTDGDRVTRFFRDMRSGEPFACAVQESGNVDVRILASYAPWGASVEQLFPLLSLQHALLCREHLLLHGAFLTYQHCGLLFTGRSGIGKTTQSRLWQRRFRAEAVNEDRAVIDASSQAVRVCGVPVAGSSPFCENKTAPLKAIIVLGQAPENSIERLSPVKALPRIMDGVYLPAAFRADLSATMELALRVCAAVPVYRLDCRPDIASAELVCRTVFGEEALCKTPI